MANACSEDSEAIHLEEIQTFMHSMFDYYELIQDGIHPSMSSKYDGPHEPLTENISKAVRITVIILHEYISFFYNHVTFEQTFKNDAKRLCLDWLDIRDNVFMKMLDTVAFAIEVYFPLSESSEKSKLELTEAITWFIEIFQEHLSNDFFKEGGWKQLDRMSEVCFTDLYNNFKNIADTDVFENTICEMEASKYECFLIKSVRESPVYFPIPKDMACEKCKLILDDQDKYYKIVYLVTEEEYQQYNIDAACEAPDAACKALDAAYKAPETGESLNKTREAPMEAIETPNVASEAYGKAGEAQDITGEPSDEAGRPSDEAGKPSDEAGKPSDEAGKPSDEALNVMDSSKNVSDEGAFDNKQRGDSPVNDYVESACTSFMELEIRKVFLKKLKDMIAEGIPQTERDYKLTVLNLMSRKYSDSFDEFLKKTYLDYVDADLKRNFFNLKAHLEELLYSSRQSCCKSTVASDSPKQIGPDKVNPRFPISGIKYNYWQFEFYFLGKAELGETPQSPVKE